MLFVALRKLSDKRLQLSGRERHHIIPPARPRPSVSTSVWRLRPLTFLPRRAGGAPDPFTICHHERVVHPFKVNVIAPGWALQWSDGGFPPLSGTHVSR